MARDYLRNHLVLATRDLDAARESVRAANVHARLILPASRFFGLISNAQLRNTGLSYYRWSAVELQGEAGGQIYCLQLHESGEIEHRYTGRVALATPSQAVFLSSDEDQVRMRMRPSRSFAVRIDRRFIDAALQRRFQRMPPLHEWAREFPIDRGPGASLRALVRWLADELDRPGSALTGSPGAIVHMEKAIRALLLDCLTHIYPRELRGNPTVAPATLRRIEEWMDANVEEAIGVEDMASVAGISVRAVQAAFRKYRGCTPREALLRRRLARARELLLNPLSRTTVTGVAFDVGLCHLGRFAARYSAMFGEAPSETLARARRNQDEDQAQQVTT